MKKFIIIICLLLIPSFSFSIDEKTYKVVIRKDWSPYYFINEDGKPTGFAIELFEKIAEKTNIKYQYVVVDDFKEIIKLFKEDKVDILPNVGISSKREELFLFTQPTDSFYVNIYKNKNSKNIVDLKDIQGKKIGLVLNNICGRLMDKGKYDRYFYTNYKDLISALKEGQIDAFCYPKPLIEQQIEFNGDIVSLQKSLKEIKRGIGISKQQFHLLPIFNEALTELKLTGEVDKLNEKWFNKHNYIELTKSETIFLVLSFFGITFTSFVIMFYFISKKKWLVTKDMLIKEVNKRTRALQIQNKRLRKLHLKLKEQSNKDELTKIYNRKYYNEKIEELLSLYKRYKTTFSFMIFDIDDFKFINDNYGHDVGDKVLKQLTQLITEDIRENDYFFRVGGEEFVILFSETSLENSLYIAEKIRVLISTKVDVVENQKITISIGLTEVNKDDCELTIFKRADKYLYEAKNSGKNIVISGV